MCGDGWIHPEETCDDGNHADGDGCSPLCEITDVLLPHCGDGFLQEGEACDAGADNSNVLPDVCRTNCRNPFCGDGIQDTGEACDDGNANERDGCTWQCAVSICGNGVIETPEECDTGVGNSNVTSNACRTVCRKPWCGDGIADAGEECDDGNEMEGDGCLKTCVIVCPENSEKVGDRCIIRGAEGCGIFCAAGNAWNSLITWLFSFIPR